MIEPNAVERFQQLEEVRRFEISIAGFDASAFLDTTQSDEAIIDTLSYFQAPSAKIVVSMGRQDGTLSLSRVRATARRFLRQSGDSGLNVRKISVSGREDDNEPLEVIDLLEDRMTETADLEQDENRRIPFATRGPAIREAWHRRRQQVIQMFGGGS